MAILPLHGACVGNVDVPRQRGTRDLRRKIQMPQILWVAESSETGARLQEEMARTSNSTGIAARSPLSESPRIQ